MPDTKPRVNDVTDDIMAKIKSGQVTMRPKWHFVAIGALSVVFVALVTIVEVFIINLFVFKTRANVNTARAEGMHNIYKIIGNSLPWWTLGAAIVGIVLLLWLLKRFEVSYRLSRTLFVASTVAVLVVLGVLLATSNLNNKLENIGPFKPLYIPRGNSQQGQESPQQSGGGGSTSGQSHQSDNAQGQGQPQQKQQNSKN